ncbi:hypothetical protein RSAG8_13420, partial [Rhizoctonia solani AG-8 WAC10335]
MPSWFLKSETQWMIDKIPAYIAFDRNERVVYNDIHADLQLLHAMHKEWAGLHQKFRHCFNYLKGVHTSKEVGDHEEEDGDEGESEDGGSEEWETESNGDMNQGTGTESMDVGLASEYAEQSSEPDKMSRIFMGSGGSVPDEEVMEPGGDTTVTAPAGPSTAAPDAESTDTGSDDMDNPTMDYLASPERVKGWKLALDELMELTQTSWTGCMGPELKSRRMNVPNNLRQVLDLMSWGVGVELYATGIMVSPKLGH